MEGYEYYKDTYGGTMGEADFIRLAPKAFAKVKLLTFGRAAHPLDIYIDNVKDACCAVADAMLFNEQGGGVASVDNDGYRVSFVAGVSKAKTDDARIYDAVLEHLGMTGLMARSVNA